MGRQGLEVQSLGHMLRREMSVCAWFLKPGKDGVIQGLSVGREEM